VDSLFGFFGTDNRTGIDTTPGVADNDYRTRLHVVIDTADSAIISMTTDAGPTREYKDKEATILIGEGEAQEGENMFHIAKVLPINGSDETLMYFKGRATDPLVTVHHQLMNGAPSDTYFETLGDLTTLPLTLFVPAVDFDFTMKFDPETRELKVRGGSKHDGFPSYEVFARYDGGPWQEIYFWDHKAEGKGAYSLFGIGDAVLNDITEVLPQ